MQTIEIKKQQQEKQLERTYPYMGMLDELMVWFTEPDTGIAISHRTDRLKVKVTGDWCEHHFTPMQGEYTFNFENK